jgi:hypothetical protein
VLRRIFGPKREQIEEWRKLHKEELNDLYSSPHIIRVFESMRMRWVGHIACMEESTGVYRVCGNLRERDHLEDPGIDGRIILGLIFRK